MQLLELREAVMAGNAPSVVNGIKYFLEANVDPGELLTGTLIPAMVDMGDLFERGEVYVPEMLIAARAMKAGLDVLKPSLVKAGIEPVGKVALGTVQGDIHDIGKNLVSMMLEGSGFEVMDLGVNATPDKFIQAAQAGAKILGLSGLLTTTIPAMPLVIKALEEAGMRDQVKVIVGGAPVTSRYAQEIGADGYAPDASQAVRLAKSLIGVS